MPVIYDCITKIVQVNQIKIAEYFKTKDCVNNCVCQILISSHCIKIYVTGRNYRTAVGLVNRVCRESVWGEWRGSIGELSV